MMQETISQYLDQYKLLFGGAFVLILIIIISLVVSYNNKPTTLPAPLDNHTQSGEEQPIQTTVDIFSSLSAHNIVHTGEELSNPVTGEQIVAEDTGLVLNVSTMRALLSGSELSGNQQEIVITYARKVEDLIAVRGQEKRTSMLITMNQFMSQYAIDDIIHDTVKKIINITKLGEVAYHIERCTNYDDYFLVNLFGKDIVIRSTVKYQTSSRVCHVMLEYGDGAIQTCTLTQEQRSALSQMLYQKQELKEHGRQVTLESLIDQYLKKDICLESQKGEEKK